MAGRVFKRSSTYWIAFSHKGKEYRHSAKTEKKREAENLLAFYLGKCVRGEFKGFVEETEVYTIAEMLEDLVNDCEQRQLRAIDTLKFRVRPLRKELGARVASELTERQIDLYVKQRRTKVMPATLQCELAYLKQGFRLAKRKHLVTDIPDIPSITVQNARQGFFEAEAFERVVAFLPDYVKDVARFSYYTGWRKREVLSLEWRFIEDDVLRLPPELSKNKDGRVLILTGVLADIIERRRVARLDLLPWIFHRKGKRMLGFLHVWKKACTLAGVPDRHYHDSRRTAVRNLTRAGVPEKIAMTITGHKTRAVFDRYNIVNEDDIRHGLERTFTHLEERRVVPLFSGNSGQTTHNQK
jgi:integrase